MRFNYWDCTIVALVSVCFLLLTGADSEAQEAIEIYARGDYERVAELLETKYTNGTANIQERILLARAYLRLGRLVEPLSVLQSVLTMDGENPEANRLTGLVLHKSSKYREAIPYLKHAFRLKEDSVTASTLGHCYYSLGKTAKAKLYLRKALEEDIRNPTNSFLLGRIYLERGSGALAEKYFLAAEEAGMDSANIHLPLGQAYLLQRKLVGPILLKRLPSNPKLGTILGDIVVLGKVRSIPEQFKVSTRYSALYQGLRALESQPNNAVALFMTASGWLAAGEITQAEKYARQLEKQEGKTARLLELRARLLIAAKDIGTLESLLDDEKVAKSFGVRRMRELWYAAALVLRGEGKRIEALSLLLKAESSSPVSGKVLRSLAELYVVTGQNKKAAEYYGRIVELFPDAHDIDILRNKLETLQEGLGGE